MLNRPGHTHSCATPRAFPGAVLPAGLLAAWLGVLCAPLLCAAPAAPAPAATAPSGASPLESCPIPGRINAADGSLSGFAPAPRLYLVIDSKEAPAEIYRVPGRAILVISPRLSSPVILANSVLASVPAAAIDRHADGTVDVRRDAQLKRLGTYQMDEASNSIAFTAEGLKQAVHVRPPLDFLRAPGSSGASPSSH
jgi:hypothetical protein